MRGYAEPVNIITGKALNVNGKTLISDEIPVGEGWYEAYLRINLIFVVGTGTTAISEGELSVIKNVLLKTDRGEILYNLPGRAIYKVAQIKRGFAPVKNAIAAASATYSVTLPLLFAGKPGRMDRPEDTILDTKRYSSLSLEIQLGTVTDLLSTIGTSSLTATLDMEVFRTKGILPKAAQPMSHISYDLRPPVEPGSATIIYMERAMDLALKRIYLWTAITAAAGVPWDGTADDTVIDILQIKDQSGFIVKDRKWKMIQNENVAYYQLVANAVLTGVGVLDFVRDGSIQSGLLTGGKSLLQASWTNGAGASGGNDQVCLTTEAFRSLK